MKYQMDLHLTEFQRPTRSCGPLRLAFVDEVASPVKSRRDTPRRRNHIQRSNRQARRTVDQRAMSFISRGLVSAGFASRKTLTSRLISRQVTSSVYVGEKVRDFTQPIRSSAGYDDQCLVSSSRVRCSLARQLFTLSSGVWLYPAKPAARQLAVRSQLGTLSATAARVRRAKASVG
jgi:hypothetical protein